MRSEATIAILSARLHKEVPLVLLSALACGLLGYVQRYDDAAAQLVGCTVFGSLCAIAVALLQRGYGRFREIELCEQSAPLFGRELARATAMVPCIVVSIAVSAYWFVAEIFGHRGAEPIALSLFAVNIAALIAMVATVRSGAARYAAILASAIVPAAAFGLSKTPIALALGVCIVVGFAALRQYGEALARYDPVEA